MLTVTDGHFTLVTDLDHGTNVKMTAGNTQLTDQWRESKHSRAVSNPIFLQIYNGTDVNGTSGVYPILWRKPATTSSSTTATAIAPFICCRRTAARRGRTDDPGGVLFAQEV